MFREFRGFDLAPRQEKIRRCMDLMPVGDPGDIPVIVHTPCYFGFGCAPVPPDYWTSPKAMLAFQQDGYEKHLKLVEDDCVPYFMPWFGTGVLASAFGCAMRDATGDGDDPVVVATAISQVEDIAHLKLPDPQKDGWMPRVLAFMEYAARHGEMPVGPTDLNSPLCTAAQICGYDNLFYWMYDEPEAMDDLMALISEAFIRWVRLQKEITGEPAGFSNGLQGVWTPKGGVWLSDDDLVSLGPDLYARFAKPHYDRIFTEFGGGHLHFCGVGTHQLDNIRSIRGLTAVNNSPMGNAEAFARLREAAQGRFVLEIQDAAPLTPETYYQKLFARIDDFSGLMVATFAEDELAMDDGGRTVFHRRDPAEAANRIVREVRAAAGARMEAES